MPSQYPEVNTFSEDVQEVIGRLPSWPIRWGITVISLVIFLFILGARFIQYPDIVHCRITLTTQFPPVNLVANTSGRIRLLVKEDDTVEKNAVLGYVKNATKYEEFTKLKQSLARIETTLVDNFSPNQIKLPGNFSMGELQSAYLALLNQIKAYQLTNDFEIKTNQIASIQQRINQYEQLNEQLEKQKQIQLKELNLVKRKFKIDQNLFQSEVIASTALDQSQLNLLQTERAYQVSKNLMVSNDINISQLVAQQNELTLDISQSHNQMRNDILLSYRQLINELNLWQQKYLIMAPFGGQVSIKDFLKNDQYVIASSIVLTLVPFSQEIYGQASMPISGSGKVEVGQKVNIKLDNYPYTEYGIVHGEVSGISAVPQNNAYSINIVLLDGLKSSFNQTLSFKQQLSGNAEIITKDFSVSDRIFRQLRQTIERSPN